MINSLSLMLVSLRDQYQQQVVLERALIIITLEVKCFLAFIVLPNSSAFEILSLGLVILCAYHWFVTFHNDIPQWASKAIAKICWGEKKSRFPMNCRGVNDIQVIFLKE